MNEEDIKELIERAANKSDIQKQVLKAIFAGCSHTDIFDEDEEITDINCIYTNTIAIDSLVGKVYSNLLKIIDHE